MTVPQDFYTVMEFAFPFYRHDAMLSRVYATTFLSVCESLRVSLSHMCALCQNF